MRNVLVALSLLVLVGCQMPSGKSLNIQRAAIRSAGDTSVTVSLDCVSTADKAVTIAKQTKEITIAVDKFLQDGKLADLTIPEITDKLRKIIPSDYQFIFDMLIAQISSQTVPVSVIGANNIKRMRAMCDGIITGCDKYSAEDRPVPTVTATRGVVRSAGVDSPQSFGAKCNTELAKRRVK